MQSQRPSRLEVEIDEVEIDKAGHVTCFEVRALRASTQDKVCFRVCLCLPSISNQNFHILRATNSTPLFSFACRIFSHRLSVIQPDGPRSIGLIYNNGTLQQQQFFDVLTTSNIVLTSTRALLPYLHPHPCDILLIVAWMR